MMLAITSPCPTRHCGKQMRDYKLYQGNRDIVLEAGRKSNTSSHYCPGLQTFVCISHD